MRPCVRGWIAACKESCRRCTMSPCQPLIVLACLCSMLTVIGSHTHDVAPTSPVERKDLPTTAAAAAGDIEDLWSDADDASLDDDESSENVIESPVQTDDQSNLKTVIPRDNRHKMAPPAEPEPEDESDESSEAPFPSSISELSKHERKKVLNSLEASFLNIVGLKSRPTPGSSVTIPDYMLDLYRQHLEGNTGRRPAQSANRRLHNSNTIRSFYQEEDNISPDGVVRLKFNISSLPLTEELQAAELRLYREASSLANQLHLSNTTAAKLDELLHSKHRIDIYQIMLPPKRSIGRDAVTRLLDTQVVEPTSSGWETFDVTLALHHWRHESKNYGLEVRFSKVSGEVSPLSHVRLKRSAQSSTSKGQDRNWDTNGPLLVTYSDDHRDGNSRNKRDTRKNRDTRRKRNPKNKDKRKKRKDRPRKHRDYKKNCKRRDLYVDFEDVGWNDWIVAPPGYMAYYCYGECPFPLPEHLNTTNHAVVQQFVNSVDPQAAPKACCVPTELSEVSLLYIDEDNKVVLRRYEEMVVEACGCR